MYRQKMKEKKVFTIDNLIIIARVCKTLCRINCKICIIDILIDMKKELKEKLDRSYKCSNPIDALTISNNIIRELIKENEKSIKL